MQEAWKAGITGKGVKVAMIDTLSASDEPSIKDADVTWHNASYVDSQGQSAQCVLGGWTMPASVHAGDTVHAGLHGGDETYQLQGSHGNSTLMSLVGNGVSWDSQPVTRGSAPGVAVTFYAHGVQPQGPTADIPARCTDKEVTDSNYPSTFIGPTVASAVDDGTRIVSVSLNVLAMSVRDYQGVLTALRHGVILLAGAPNRAGAKGLTDRTTGIPGPLYGAPGVTGVGNVGPDGALYPDVANGGVQVESPGHALRGMTRTDERRLESISGTSAATPTLAGYLALAMQKWPDATGNQILQSLVRTTKEAQSSGQMAKGDVWTDDAHKRGFGQVDVKALLDTDPTQWPDINPILEMQLLNAADDKDATAWYGQDCGTNPDGIIWTSWEGQAVRVPCEWGGFKQEYERQKAAWNKVKQCKADGGSDCMQYSATATAPKDSAGASGGASQSGGSVRTDPAVPAWAWWAGGVGAVVVLAGVALAIVLSRRGRKARVGGRHGGAGMPTVNGGQPPYGRQGPEPHAGPSPYMPGMPAPRQTQNPYPPAPQTMPGPGQLQAPYAPPAGGMPYAYGHPTSGTNPTPTLPSRRQTPPTPMPPQQPPRPYGQRPQGPYGNPPRDN